jgi:hypothetical protein
MAAQGPVLPGEKLSSWKHEQSLLRIASPYHQDDIAKYLEQGVKEQGHEQQEKALQRDIRLLAHAQAQKFRQIRKAQKFRQQVRFSGSGDVRTIHSKVSAVCIKRAHFDSKV